MSSSMPHATSPLESQEELDDLLIQQALDPENPIDFNRELEPGEKADDAIDFGDLSDDDLAEDEDGAQVLQPPKRQAGIVEAGLEDPKYLVQDDEAFNSISADGHEGDGFDDLFGEIASSPTDNQREPSGLQILPRMTEIDDSFELQDDRHVQQPSGTILEPSEAHVINQSVFRPISLNSKNTALSREQQLQQELFAMSGSGIRGMDVLPAPPENQEELLVSLWPKFERGTVLKFMDLLPPKKTRYMGKKNLKRPRAIQPSKVNLELAPDQEKTFKLSAPTSRKTQEDMDHANVILVPSLILQQRTADPSEDIESDFEEDRIGGVSWQDLQMICEQWDDHGSKKSLNPSQARFDVKNQQEKSSTVKLQYQDSSDLSGGSVLKVGANSFLIQSVLIMSQKRKLHHAQFELPSLKDPERAALVLARKVTLDLNDSLLLVDSDRLDATAPRNLKRIKTQHSGRVVFAKGLGQRYNVSNDDAYDLLKENHQSKIRSTLGTLTVDHSTPAIRLQWPYVSSNLA